MAAKRPVPALCPTPPALHLALCALMHLPSHQRRMPRTPVLEFVAGANAKRSAVRLVVEHVFAGQRHRTGLFNRTIGIAHPRLKIVMANLAYDVQRLLWLEGRSTPAWRQTDARSGALDQKTTNTSFNSGPFTAPRPSSVSSRHRQPEDNRFFGVSSSLMIGRLCCSRMFRRPSAGRPWISCSVTQCAAGRRRRQANSRPPIRTCDQQSVVRSADDRGQTDRRHRPRSNRPWSAGA